ncbi:MAG: hypothetical protein SNJ63_07090 [Sphingomonadaceae bacterium]
MHVPATARQWRMMQDQGGPGEALDAPASSAAPARWQMPPDTAFRAAGGHA